MLVEVNSVKCAQVYYRCMNTHTTLYKAMKTKYEMYITRDYLLQLCHSFDTQKNEGMNNYVAKQVPKGKNQCEILFLLTRVHIVLGVQLVGYHLLWTHALKELEVSCPPQLINHFLVEDKSSLCKYHKQHGRWYKANRIRLLVRATIVRRTGSHAARAR